MTLREEETIHIDCGNVPPLSRVTRVADCLGMIDRDPDPISFSVNLTH